MSNLLDHRRRRRPGPPLAALLLVLLVALAAFLLWAGFRPAAVELVKVPAEAGPARPLEILLRAGGGAGLAGFTVNVTDAAGRTVELARTELPGSLLGGGGLREHRATIALDPTALALAEGPARILVEARDRSPLAALLDLGGQAEAKVAIDRTPPAIEIVPGLVYGRRGGSVLVVALVDGDAARTTLGVGDTAAQATLVATQAGGRHVVASLLPVGRATDPEASAVAQTWDAAGNRAEARQTFEVKAANFPAEDLTIDQAFIERKIKPLLVAEKIAVPADPVAAYLLVNRDLRQTSEARLREIAARSEADGPARLGIDSALRQPPDTEVGSRFAEERTYFWSGREIDRQTHLGYDLASTRQAPVPAAQAGRVAFAGPLGIYGTTVILDHGLGLGSLYAHLSHASVTAGQQVGAATILGATGESGLAGGDHLHFSTILHGHHVDALEWWDPHWVRLHVLERLAAVAPVPGAVVEPAAGRDPGSAGEAPAVAPSAQAPAGDRDDVGGTAAGRTVEPSAQATAGDRDDVGRTAAAGRIVDPSAQATATGTARAGRVER